MSNGCRIGRGESVAALRHDFSRWPRRDLLRKRWRIETARGMTGHSLLGLSRSALRRTRGATAISRFGLTVFFSSCALERILRSVPSRDRTRGTNLMLGGLASIVPRLDCHPTNSRFASAPFHFLGRCLASFAACVKLSTQRSETVAVG
jgi:hypothetical protein